MLPESMREQAFRRHQQVARRKLLARSITPSPSTAVTARMPLAQRVLLRMSFISRNVMGATDFGCGQIPLLVSRRMIGLATATLLTLVNQVSGTPYVSGGDSPRGTDCSGLASWVANAATGRPIYGDRFNTRNQESALLARGFRYGTEPGALVIGWNGGHTAVTLPDGTPVSSGEGGGVKVGGGGAYQPQFNHHMYLPAVEPDATDAPPADAPPPDAPPPLDPFAAWAPAAARPQRGTAPGRRRQRRIRGAGTRGRARSPGSGHGAPPCAAGGDSRSCARPRHRAGAGRRHRRDLTGFHRAPPPTTSAHRDCKQHRGPVVAQCRYPA